MNGDAVDRNVFDALADALAEIERLRIANEVLSVTLDGLYEQRGEYRRLLRELITHQQTNHTWLGTVAGQEWLANAAHAAIGEATDAQRQTLDPPRP
jgi:hypothetical protein